MGLEYVKNSVDFQSHSGIRGGLRTLDRKLALEVKRAQQMNHPKPAVTTFPMMTLLRCETTRILCPASAFCSTAGYTCHYITCRLFK